MASENKPTGGSNMSTTTIDDQLAEARRRIARLQALAQTGLAERARIQRHLDALHQEEASVLFAERRAPDEVEERLGQLRTRLAVAENSVAADVSDEWTTFAISVGDELRSWDTYLERLQATAVAKAGNARERAEAAIADVRARRITVYDRLAQAHGAAGDGEDSRERVTAARDALEQKAADLSAKIKWNGYGNEEIAGRRLTAHRASDIDERPGSRKRGRGSGLASTPRTLRRATDSYGTEV
jgi:chromosome segregation ATPase